MADDPRFIAPFLQRRSQSSSRETYSETWIFGKYTRRLSRIEANTLFAGVCRLSTGFRETISATIAKWRSSVRLASVPPNSETSKQPTCQREINFSLGMSESPRPSLHPADESWLGKKLLQYMNRIQWVCLPEELRLIDRSAIIYNRRGG